MPTSGNPVSIAATNSGLPQVTDADTIYFDLSDQKIYVGSTPVANYNTSSGDGTITGITTTAPLSGSGTSGSVALSHAVSGVTAGTYGDSTAQTPSFGGTFSVNTETVDATGHVTAVSSHTVTIPSTEASTSAAGLMSSADKTKLNGISSGAEANVQADWTETSSSSDAYIQHKPSIPSKTSDLNNDSGFITIGDVPPIPDGSSTTPIMDGNASIGSSTTYARADHVHPADTTKVDKVTGKGLSTNDYTDSDKNKLAGIATGAEVNVQSDWSVTDSTSDAFIKSKPSIPTKTSDITNDSGYITIADVPEGAVASTTTPKMNGTAAVGTETAFARGDHVHPSDTSRAPLNSPALTGTPTAPTASSGTSTTQIATTAFVQNALSGAIPTSQKGANNGVAELDSTGKVPSSQLPAFVDDVLEYNSKSAFPSTGETGKIYIDKATNLTYRWSGTDYVEVSPSLALGTTSSTAFRGDYGNTAYTHATDSGRLTTATSSGFYKIASTAQGHIASLTAVTKADITALGIPGSDTNTTYTVTSESIGSASTGTAIPADDITAWSQGTLPSITISSVDVGTSITPTSGNAPSFSVTNGVLTLSEGSTPLTGVTLNISSIGSASNWSAGTLPSLSYTAKSIPNISVTSKSVVTSVTADAD